jgi:glycosyltransferase involved in cell wall biosynthesis
MNKVSIIIPTYNRADLILNTLESIIAQTYICWECIVVDDNSSDATIHLISEFSSRDSRFQIVRNENKKGASGARNTGLKNANGSFVMFFDSDDIMYPDNIERKVNFLEQNQDCGAVTSFSHIKNENNLVVDILVWKTHGDIFEKLVQYSTYVDTNTALIRRSLLENYRWDEDTPSYQEWDFHLGLAQKGVVYGMIWNFTGAYYRRGIDTISSDLDRDSLGQMYVIIKWFREFRQILGDQKLIARIEKINNWESCALKIMNEYSLPTNKEFGTFMPLVNRYRRNEKLMRLIKKVVNGLP